MSALTLHLESATRYERIPQVASFIGQDASGSFGILPGHAHFATVLEFGLARFCTVDGRWQYLAAPGAVVRVAGDALHFSTRRYVCDDDIGRVRAALRDQLAAEEQALRDIRRSLRRLEQEMVKRLCELSRAAERT